MSTLTLDTELKNRIREIVADVLEIELDELEESSNFEDAYGADSIVVIEILARFERSLNISIPQNAVDGLTSLGAAYQIVAENVAEPADRG
ncbi:acyl carrier protein [Streptomyces sp. NBC_00454]|uniref:acyl carrier protein n=1 Tax=Streptomyces sp. NBC_00454 TaxID=2975747 RepID=UPI0030E53D7D